VLLVAQPIGLGLLALAAPVDDRHEPQSIAKQ
jgi:hypothetical protein